MSFFSRAKGQPPPPEGAAGGGQSLERLKPALAGIEGVLTRAGIGAARISVRLKKVAKGHELLGVNAAEVQSATTVLSENIREVAGAAASTAEAAREMAELTELGQETSRLSADSARQLCEHTRLTEARLNALMEKILKVTNVSKVIDGIATRTNLLALNAAIEAAHAGHMGRGFAVVAEEVRKLAEITSQQTQEIGGLLDEVVAELAPARQAMADSLSLATHTLDKAEEAGRNLEEILELAQKSLSNVEYIAMSMAGQSEATQILGESTQVSVTAIQELGDASEQIARESQALSSVSEDGHHFLGGMDTGSFFDQALALGRGLAVETGRILERPVREGKCSLEDLLDLRYTEIAGDAIQGLARLFSVQRVPPAGFTPPKFATTYDAWVDEALQPLFDAWLEKHPRLIFALALDLNAYAPTHNRKVMQGWTGDPEQDLAGNRVKRFFDDSPALLRGSRMALGDASGRVPPRSDRTAFRKTGCDLARSAAAQEAFLVQTYARDTGAVVSILTVPLFVQDQRYGVSLLGWTED